MEETQSRPALSQMNSGTQLIFILLIFLIIIFGCYITGAISQKDFYYVSGFLGIVAVISLVVLTQDLGFRRRILDLDECDQIAREKRCSSVGNDTGYHIGRLLRGYLDRNPKDTRTADPCYTLVYDLVGISKHLVVKVNAIRGNITFIDDLIPTYSEADVFDREFQYIQGDKPKKSLEDWMYSKRLKAMERKVKSGDKQSAALTSKSYETDYEEEENVE